MKKVFFIIAVAAFMGGCSGFLKDKVLTDDDNNFQISIPSSWATMYNLSDQADIQAGNSIDGKYLMVYIENKEDFTGFDDLDGYAALILKNWTSGADDVKAEIHEELTIDGMKAKSFIINDSDKGRRYRNLVTFVESDTHFVQIVVYCVNSEFDNYLKGFKKITDTFKKVSSNETKTEN